MQITFCPKQWGLQGGIALHNYLVEERFHHSSKYGSNNTSSPPEAENSFSLSINDKRTAFPSNKTNFPKNTGQLTCWEKRMS